MGAEEFSKNVSTCYEQGYRVLIYDEAGDYAKVNFMSKLNKILTRIFETYRAFKVMVILCLPNMKKLDKTIFENQLCRFSIKLYGKKNGKVGKFRVFSLYRCFYLLDKLKSYRNPGDAYKQTRPNLFGYNYPLPPERQAKLDKLSTASKVKIHKDINLKQQGLYTTEEVAEKLGFTRLGSFRVFINSHKIKGKKIKGRAYYSEALINYMMSIRLKNKGAKDDEPI